MKIACTRCGANLSFMPSTQNFYCEYCGSQINISELDNESYKEDNISENDKSTYDEYTCSTCGAKLITDDTTTITDCIYCGSRQILKARFNGNFDPVEIIPFKIDRNQFIKKYIDFINKRKFAPKDFKNNNRLVETKGMYVPFHLFFFDVDTYARGKAVRTSQRDPMYMYFETEFNMRTLVPIDSSKKFDDNIMASLDPFNYNELIKFNPAFLNGFLSENGDENLEELERKAEARSIKQAKRELNSVAEGYDLVRGKYHTNIKKLENRYVLLPVWFINTWYNNKKYSYAVNGQTGKVVGSVPISKAKFTTFIVSLCLLTTIFSVIIINLIANLNGDVGLILAIILLIWFFVFLTFFLIIFIYKNISVLYFDPIQSWNFVKKKYKTYTKGQYKKMFGDEELETMDEQLFRNGVNVKEINNNQQNKVRKKVG